MFPDGRQLRERRVDDLAREGVEALVVLRPDRVRHDEGVVPRRAEAPACDATMPWKGSVISTVAGTPASSSSTASCRLHDEHAPQSPTPVTTRWARAAISRACAG